MGFADWNRLQYLPSAQLKRRPDGRERDIELQTLAGKIISQLLASCSKITMFARDDVRPQLFSKD